MGRNGTMVPKYAGREIQKNAGSNNWNPSLSVQVIFGAEIVNNDVLMSFKKQALMKIDVKAYSKCSFYGVLQKRFRFRVPSPPFLGGLSNFTEKRKCADVRTTAPGVVVFSLSPGAS